MSAPAPSSTSAPRGLGVYRAVLAVPGARRFVAAGLLGVELALGGLITVAGLAPTQTNGIDATIAVLYSAAAVGIMAALAQVLGAALPAAVDADRSTPVPHEVGAR